MTTGTLPRRRSAYGLDSETPVDWRQRAACRGYWDLFTGFPPTQYDVQATAAHICYRHCAALGQCEIFSALHHNDGVVLAGGVWNGGRRAELADPGCGKHCAHLRRRS